MPGLPNTSKAQLSILPSFAVCRSIHDEVSVSCVVERFLSRPFGNLGDCLPAEPVADVVGVAID